MAVLPLYLAAPSPPPRLSSSSPTSSYAGFRNSAPTVATPSSSNRGISARLASFSASPCPSPRRRPARAPGLGSRNGSDRIGSVRGQAVGEGSQGSVDPAVYQGVYGPWTVDSSDVREVILYRSGLVTAAASFVLAASAAFFPEGNIVRDTIKQQIDILYLVGAGGLGLSLVLIHIYVTPIKRFLQALWVIGAIGSVATYLALARPLDESLVQYVIDNPIALWLVGPVFAALTGLVFKEGLCYGKLEAGILTFIIPGVLLGHLTGLIDDAAKVSLLGVWMGLFVVFAARKFQQPIKDDIGDKSVFMFNALSEGEKKALLQKLEQNYD